MPRLGKRLGRWFRGYDDAPLWLCVCRLVFSVSFFSFVLLFFGPAILGGDLIGFWMYQDWALTQTGFLYLAAIVTTLTLVAVSGIPTVLYEKKKMRQMKN